MIDYTKRQTESSDARGSLAPVHAQNPAERIAGSVQDTVAPTARPGQEYRENMLLERLDRLSDELEELHNAGAPAHKIEQMNRRIEITLESIDEVRQPKTGRRGPGDITVIELGVLIVLAVIVILVGKAIWGHFSDADSSSSVASTSASSDQAFLNAVHSETSVPDPDDVLMGVGGVICLSIEEKGESATRAEFATSSYNSSDQDVIWAAAQSYLC